MIRKMRKIFKKVAVVMALVMAVAIGMGSWSTPAQAQDITLNLKAVWNPNPEPDMLGYYFFDVTASSKAWNGTGWAVDELNPFLLPLTPQQLLFTRVTPMIPATGNLKFNMKAVDTNINVGIYMPVDALYAYNFDIVPPGQVTGLVITKQ